MQIHQFLNSISLSALMQRHDVRAVCTRQDAESETQSLVLSELAPQ